MILAAYLYLIMAVSNCYEAYCDERFKGWVEQRPSARVIGGWPPVYFSAPPLFRRCYTWDQVKLLVLLLFLSSALVLAVMHHAALILVGAH